MSLNNRVGRSLERITPDAANIRKLITAAARNIKDARVKKISLENRFDAAYKAIMQLANAVLQANGLRTLTSKPGHHIVMLDSMGEVFGLSKMQITILHSLRKQRNLADYSGDTVPKSAVEECLKQADDLYQVASEWFSKNKPELIEKK